MRFTETFQLYDFLDTLVSLLTAFVLGTLIGAERQYRQRSAGLRTNVLVAVGASAFVDLANRLGGADGSVRVIAYVVSGIGFLGAGAIMKEGMNVRGLNTAATLWASAAVGCCAGADMVAQAALLTIFVLGGNTLLRPLVNAIDRIPIDEKSSEASYDLLITADSGAVATVREALLEKLEAANYPVRDSSVIYRSGETADITATLVSLSIEPNELDAVAASLAGMPGVRHATWQTPRALRADGFELIRRMIGSFHLSPQAGRGRSTHHLIIPPIPNMALTAPGPRSPFPRPVFSACAARHRSALRSAARRSPERTR
jgi:putative Mg2+ transporter-C (MgtC) family protein